MSATITKTTTGYLIKAGCTYHQKYSLKDALDFCRLLGFKAVLAI